MGQIPAVCARASKGFINNNNNNTEIIQRGGIWNAYMYVLAHTHTIHTCTNNHRDNYPFPFYIIYNDLPVSMYHRLLGHRLVIHHL